MKKAILYIFATLSLAVAGTACRTLPPVEPASPQSAALGLRLRTGAKILGLIDSSRVPTTVLFARVPAGRPATEAAALMPATFVRKDRYYLLNVDPRYRYCPVVAVFQAAAQTGTTAAISPGDDRTGYVFFARRTVEAACTEGAAPGNLSFLGDFHVVPHDEAPRLDNFQKHFMEVIVPGSSARFGQFFGPRFQADDARATRVERNPAARASFLERAGQDFAGSKWSPVLFP